MPGRIAFSHLEHRRRLAGRCQLALLCLWLGLVGPWVATTVTAQSTNSTEQGKLPPSHSVKPELYATGLAFAEGPALNEAGDLFVVNYRLLGTIGRITADGTAGIFCDLLEKAPLEGRQPQANGLKIDGEGRLIVADAGGGRLLRISEDGRHVEVLADRWEGTRFDGVNDVALDTRGNIYFTDPGQSTAENPTGSVYRYDIVTKQISRLATGLAYPNGIAVSVDQKQLCVAESRQYRVMIYDLTPDGKATGGRVLVDFPDETDEVFKGGKFDPDGMIVDSQNRLYVAMWRGGVINVVDIGSGVLLRQYEAGGGRATNCHFHDGWLYTTVAAKEAVFRLKLGVEGFDYNGR